MSQVKLNPFRFYTYQWSLVGHWGQNVIKDEEEHRDGQQHCYFEAQFFPSMISDEERGKIQNKEKQDGQQKIDNMK